MVHYDVCPLCSSDKISVHLQCKDHSVSQESFNICKCLSCNFEFTQDHPDEDNIALYYESEEYISHSNTSKGLLNKIYKIVRSYMLRRKKRIIENFTGINEGVLLDIGSGTGYFPNFMSKSGWEVKGVEINEKARKFSISNFGLNIIEPREISTLEPDSFDCITLWHVLEHFHDPYKYASDIFRLLKPGGACIIALPNNTSSDAKYYGQYWSAYDVPRHLWHFNPPTFKKFSNKAGFEILNIKNLPFDVFYISILSEKYMGVKYPVISGTIKALYFAIQSMIKNERSSSLIYLLKKPEHQ